MKQLERLLTFQVSNTVLQRLQVSNMVMQRLQVSNTVMQRLHRSVQATTNVSNTVMRRLQQSGGENNSMVTPTHTAG